MVSGMNILRILLWLCVSVFSLSAFAQASTVSKQDLVGTWVVREPPNSISKTLTYAFLSKSPEKSPVLTITPNFDVTLKRTFDKNRIQYTVADSITVVEEIYHITLKKEEEEHKRYQLVLSGWSQQETQLLFGYLYLYDKNGQIFNGWPLTFEKKPTKK